MYCGCSFQDGQVHQCSCLSMVQMECNGATYNQFEDVSLVGMRSSFLLTDVCYCSSDAVHLEGQMESFVWLQSSIWHLPR